MRSRLKASRPNTSTRSLRIWIDASDATFDSCEAARIDKIGLVDKNDVGERELLLRFRRAIDLFEEMLGVRDGDDGVELCLAADVLVDKERLRHRRGIREPCGLVRVHQHGAWEAARPVKPSSSAGLIDEHGPDGSRAAGDYSVWRPDRGNGGCRDMAGGLAIAVGGEVSASVEQTRLSEGQNTRTMVQSWVGRHSPPRLTRFGRKRSQLAD
jgi:hypothetical protein